MHYQIQPMNCLYTLSCSLVEWIVLIRIVKQSCCASCQCHVVLLQPIWSTMPRSHDEPRQDCCMLKVLCLLPSTANSPPQIAVTLTNPRLILLRRFVTNIIFAMSIVTAETSTFSSTRTPQQATNSTSGQATASPAAAKPAAGGDDVPATTEQGATHLHRADILTVPALSTAMYQQTEIWPAATQPFGTGRLPSAPPAVLPPATKPAASKIAAVHEPPAATPLQPAASAPVQAPSLPVTLEGVSSTGQSTASMVLIMEVSNMQVGCSMTALGLLGCI